ncbi:hypothetical protein CDD82_6723 [Ophiocordyceps australis]|uniref:Uncharacterized protein n=1 Tax=Ophiocordyceps australis TaxID=1399860 RepID=A0A2C5YQU5_9HYPO|nr:hypothetical protein CDD82_6723 [Ophiocordyceps australis]
MSFLSLDLPQDRTSRAHDSSQAPTLPPQESLTLDLKEALGLLPSTPSTLSPTTSRVVPGRDAPPGPAPKPSNQSLAHNSHSYHDTTFSQRPSQNPLYQQSNHSASSRALSTHRESSHHSPSPRGYSPAPPRGYSPSARLSSTGSSAGVHKTPPASFPARGPPPSFPAGHQQDLHRVVSAKSTYSQGRSHRPHDIAEEPALPPFLPLVAEHTRMNMTSSNKAQSQCLHLCKNIAAAGDQVAERMAEYSSLVKHLPHGFDQLANELLDACQVLFYIEAGLEEAVRTAHPLPLEMVTVLEKRFRAAQADFRVLDQMVNKFLEYERRGAMGRMRRGFGKMFGDSGIEKMKLALQKRREDLKMSALMFQWNLGTDKIETEPGIGYIGLAAVLDDSNLRRSRNESLVGINDDKNSVHRSIPSRHQSHHESQHEDARLANAHHGQPLPLLPPTKDDHLGPFSPESTSGESSHFTQTNSDMSAGSPTTRYTVSSTTSSYDGHVGHKKANMQDRRGTYVDETLEPPRENSREMDALLADINNLDLDSTKVVNLKSEPFDMPRRRPRSNVDAEKHGSKHALVSAVRVSDHKSMMQLLDRGVSPNTGAEAHALNEAVSIQDSESVRVLLLYGADPNEPDGDGVSPLVAAAEKSFLSAAAALLKYGADPNLTTDPDLETPLAVATIANNVRLAHLMLMYGGNPNSITAERNTLLISCINKKTPAKLVDLLLGYGADPNDKNHEGKTALFEAITCGRADIVTSLLENKANPNLPGPKHMLWPSTHQPACLKVLLAHGADFRKAPGIMELATSINQMESIGILLKAGVDPNAKKDGVYTPLCSSIRDNRPDIFHLLLSSGADPNLPASEYPAFKCVTHNRVQFLPALVAAGAKLNSPKGILETAVTSNNGEALRWLLDQGLDPDEKNSKGHTALTSAIRDNRLNFVETLLKRGANPNIRGQDWPVCMAVRHPEILKRILTVLPEPRAFKGVLEMAVVANQIESIKLLLAAGVSVEDRNGGVFSPLTSAIREHRTEIVRFLIEQGGADVNAPGEHLPIVKGLRRCAAGDEASIIDLLLDNGADPNKVYRGWNGIMQALENGDPDMLRKLCEKSGVNVDVRDDNGRTVTEIAVSRRWEEAVSIMLDNAM